MTVALSGCVISTEPLVLMSARTEALPLGLCSSMPEPFRNRPSLHFVIPTHSLEDFYDSLERALATARHTLPLASFVILANEEAELVQLQARGITAFIANNLILTDETVFAPEDGAEKRFDAVYNGLFMPVKNHQLCADIASLALIHYPLPQRADSQQASYEAEIRQLLRHAEILNEPAGAPYRRLTATEVARALNTCRVGLCLSQKEGAMRACYEYLLCGLPIVTVPSIGGRARYLTLGNSRTVAPSAAAVARAVDELASLNLDPNEIRQETLTVLDFERRNFLTYVNACIEMRLGVSNCVRNFACFRGSTHYHPIAKWKTWLGIA